MNRLGTRFSISNTAVVNEDGLAVLDEATQAAHGLLINFAANQDFLAGIKVAFGSLFDIKQVEILLQQWTDNNFETLPKIVVLPAIELNGARGAFSRETNQIYLSEAFITQNTANPRAIAKVLLEEIGHYADIRLNKLDAAGDEGEIFAALAQGQSLDSQQLQALKAQNDAITIKVNGESIVAEAAEPTDNLGLLSESLDSFLDSIKTAVGKQVLDLPLLEDISLQPLTDEFINSLKQKLLDGLEGGANKTAESVRNTFLQVLGPQGLDLLQDSTADDKVDLNDVLLTSNANQVEFKFKVGKSFNPNVEFDDNLGLPNLDFELDGGVTPQLDLGLTLDFGVNNSGFFINTSNDDELEAKLGIKLLDSANKPLELGGTFGFLELKATDNGSELSGSFQADLTGSTSNISIVNPTLAITQADLKLKLNTGVDKALGIDNGILPSITSDFNLLQLQTTVPNVQFNNVELNLGEFVNNFARDILEGIQKVTAPFNPVFNILNQKLPVIGISLIDLAKNQKSTDFLSGTDELIRQIGYLSELSELFNSIPTGSISLGNFSFTGTNANPQFNNNTNIPPSTQSPITQVTDVSSIPFIQQLTSNTKGALTFPLITEPTTAIKLLLGQENVPLFTYKTPKLGFKFNFEPPSIPIFGPVSIGFTAEAGASAQLEFGFDTEGLKKFKEDGFENPGLIFDGFYVSRPDQSDNLSLTGLIAAKVGVSIGIAEVAVGGGISPEFNLNADGKVRGSTINSKGPLCFFTIGGDLSAIVFASFTLNFGFFSFSQRLDLADIVLVDFGDTEIPCEDLGAHFPSNKKANPEDEDFQSLLEGQGIINRKGTDSNDIITVISQGGTSKDDATPNTTVNDKVLLQGLDDPAKEYGKVRLIVINGGQGNDRIEFKPENNLQARGQLEGAEGNDTLITAKGDDFLTGGQGSDTLNGGEGKDTAVYAGSPTGVAVALGGISNPDGYGTFDTLIDIENLEGSSQNDQLTGNDQDNVLNSGEGNDTLKGGKGKDVLLAGAGADDIDGGDDEDTITYIGSKSPVRVNLSSQTASIVNPFDPFNQFTPTPSFTFLVANKGSGSEAEGDTISNVENVQGTIYDDILVAGNFGDGYIDGFNGNDLIFAGLKSDKLIGGEGFDWLSYRLSDRGVEVNLKDNSFSEGYANGDELKFVNDKGEEKDGNSFENLEGSLSSDGELRGENQSNTIKGLAGDDRIFGEGENDTLIGGPGADLLEGGDGVDTASYQDSSDFVIANLVDQGASQGDAAGDTFAGVENLFGSIFGDALTGDSGNNDINPGVLNGQNDKIDTIDGYFGIDSLTLDYGSYDNGKGIQGGFQDIAIGSGFVLRATRDGSGEERVNFTQIERLLAVGTFQNDQITGGSDSDILLMGSGNDTVDGGGGNDQLDGDDGIDTLSDDLSNESQNIQLISTDITKENPNANYGLITRFEIFKNIKTGSGNDQLTQLDRIDNNFSTAAGNDTVNPGLGLLDNADGGDGDDLLILDYSISDTGGSMFVNVSPRDNSGSAYRVTDPNDPESSTLDSITFTKFERYQAIGTSKDDSIVVGDGSDSVTGGLGSDILTGNRGNDELVGGDGNDTLRGTNNFDYGGEFIPDSQPDTFGTYIPDVPKDVDTLIGGVGADTFVLGDVGFPNTIRGDLFYNNAGNDDYATITDFNAAEGDIIQLTKGGNGSSVEPKQNYSLSYTSSGTQIFSREELIALVQGNFLSLDEAYFNFVGEPNSGPPR